MKEFIMSKVLAKSNAKIDSTEILLTVDRLLTAVNSNDSQNVSFNSIKELEGALGI